MHSAKGLGAKEDRKKRNRAFSGADPRKDDIFGGKRSGEGRGAGETTTVKTQKEKKKRKVLEKPRILEGKRGAFKYFEQKQFKKGRFAAVEKTSSISSPGQGRGKEERVFLKRH